MPFTKGNKLNPKRNRHIVAKEKVAELATIPKTTTLTMNETLLNATNRTIDIYNKIAESFKDEDIVKMSSPEKIAALQKLSYLFATTRKLRPTKLNLTQINTDNKTVSELESHLLELNKNEEENEL